MELFAGVSHRIWQARFYDFNVCSERKRIEKLRYIHRNPVKRGLVVSAEQWRWGSYRDYALQDRGVVRLNDCTVLRLKKIAPTKFGDVQVMPAATSTQVSKTARPGAPKRFRVGKVGKES